MGSDRAFPVKLLATVAIVVTLGFGVEMLFMVGTARYPDGHPLAGKAVELWQLEYTPDLLRQIASPVSRSYNQLLALVLTFIALAVPITANHYTPKLLRIFLRDRVNLWVLCALGVLSAHSIVTLLLSHELITSHLSFWITIAGSLVGWAALTPYYFYVLSFLNPETIIERVTAELVGELRGIPQARQPVAALQRSIGQKVTDLGSIILRAGERSDRDVSVSATRAMADAFVAYLEVKPRIAPAFFRLETGSMFTGASRAAVELIEAERIWVEHKALQQLILAYKGALAKMPDTASALSDAVNHLAAETARLGDRPALDLVVRVLNTFLRDALNKKDVRAIFDVFYQYKSLARKLMQTHADVVTDLVEHLRYYAVTARQLGMAFIHELAAYELAEICQLAHDRGLAQLAVRVRDGLFAIEGVEKSVGLVKARAILGAYLLEHGLDDELTILVASLREVPRPLLEQACREIQETRKRVFWEVTDRQVNLDWVDDARKLQVAQLFNRLGIDRKTELLPESE
jgi:hypothetical protein